MPNFVFFAASIAELAHTQRKIAYSHIDSPNLFDAPGTEACALEYISFYRNGGRRAGHSGLCAYTQRTRVKIPLAVSYNSCFSTTSTYDKFSELLSYHSEHKVRVLNYVRHSESSEN